MKKDKDSFDFQIEKKDLPEKVETESRKHLGIFATKTSWQFCQELVNSL